MSDSSERYNELLLRKHYSQRTIGAYASWVQALARYYPERDLAALESAEVRAFLDNLKERRRLSKASQRQARSAVDLFFKQIVGKDHQIPPTGHSWDDRKLPSIPTQAEILQILESVPEQTYRLALTCMYGMGLELTEALSLKVRNVDLKQGIVHIPQLRRKGQRRAILPQRVHEELSQMVSKKKPDDLVFTTKGNAGCSESSLQRAFARSRSVHGLSSTYTLRSLRYAYIKHLEQLGVPLGVVFDHVGLNRSQSLAFYSRIGAPDSEVTFSPIDRRIDSSDRAAEQGADPYVAESRIAELSSLKSADFDLTRLLELIRELNIACRSNSFMAIAMLVRSIINHVPPIFGYQNFNEVVSNYAGGTSFKKSMEHLNTSLRSIADSHLHVVIRKKETLPNFMQVNFRSDLDVLLSEVVRLLK